MCPQGLNCRSDRQSSCDVQPESRSPCGGDRVAGDGLHSCPASFHRGRRRGAAGSMLRIAAMRQLSDVRTRRNVVHILRVPSCPPAISTGRRRARRRKRGSGWSRARSCAFRWPPGRRQSAADDFVPSLAPLARRRQLIRAVREERADGRRVRLFAGGHVRLHDVTNRGLVARRLLRIRRRRLEHGQERDASPPASTHENPPN